MDNDGSWDTNRGIRALEYFFRPDRPSRALSRCFGFSSLCLFSFSTPHPLVLRLLVLSIIMLSLSHPHCSLFSDWRRRKLLVFGARERRASKRALHKTPTFLIKKTLFLFLSLFFLFLFLSLLFLLSPSLPPKNVTVSLSSTSATPASPSATTTWDSSHTRSSPATPPGTPGRRLVLLPLPRPLETQCSPRNQS